ncbi:uncharacterized membrane protein YkvA (DUF1232 family) [Gelidibacter sediminis]|uniref:Uncharacterized membrane protein YkvA (DUF1232 family) n=1 Tax=Gelidibacter sediminis TaxID=1608710 RepID=A0A4R7PXS1_9FLAO|nr:YkvA family protein [Gelidibacter sediminis]TDU39767.1 uncharacterized membrane protein YkvA (DUF1232 family) [Gelidibacter sediminis]
MKFTKQQAQQEHIKASKKFSKEDLNTILKKDDELNKKFKNNNNLLEYWEDFKLLFSLIKDYSRGVYTQIPWLSIVSIGAALAYVLSPIDAIPDFLPVVGLIDDAAVFAFCIRLLSKDIEDYKNWKESQL